MQDIDRLMAYIAKESIFESLEKNEFSPGSIICNVNRS